MAMQFEERRIKERANQAARFQAQQLLHDHREARGHGQGIKLSLEDRITWAIEAAQERARADHQRA